MSILLRGGTEHVVDEMERSLEDALSVVAVAAEDETYVIGGGAIQMELSLGLKDYAGTVGGREQLAVEKFARALEVVPRTLAENAGMDAVDTLIDLRQRHQDGKAAEGVDPFGAKTADMKKLGVFEPLRVTKQAIASATDAAVMVLRIDDVIASKGPKDTGKGKMPGGGPEGPGEFD